MRAKWVFAAITACAIAHSQGASAAGVKNLAKIKHIIVIFEENRSFDSLYGRFPNANGLDRTADGAPQAAFAPQIDLNDGKPFASLPSVCWRGHDYPSTDPATGAQKCDQKDPMFLAQDPLGNAPFDAGKVLPLGLASLEDLTHRFYQEQIQIDGGKMDKFAAISNAGGLTMGYFDGSQLKMWEYARQYVLADNFFHAAFGGSFLNHMWLACACTPVFPDAPDAVKAQLAADGTLTKDGAVTPDGFAVNTIMPAAAPHPPEDPKHPWLPPQDAPTIGDRLSDHKPNAIGWTWYSDGFDDAMAGRNPHQFQYHHQPYVYFRRYGEGKPDRAHLKDGKDFESAIKNGSLPAVSFYKPSGDYNQHPNYSTLAAGDCETASLIEHIQANKKLWASSVIIVTYDENGGQWDHVAPPKIDKWGPGTRIPAIIISPFARRHFVDHTQYDTTSILKFIEVRYGLKPLTSRDAAANDLTNALRP
jgi:phospholipase C